MTKSPIRIAVVASLSLAALAWGSAAAARTPRLGAAATLSLGRNAAGEPCTATLSARDPAITNGIDKSYQIGCRNVAASRPLGSIRIVDRGGLRDPIDATLTCGEAREFQLRDVGVVAARRCYDMVLDATTIAFEKKRAGRLYIVSAAPAVLGPAEEGLRILAGYKAASADRDRATETTINVAELGVAPAIKAAANSDAGDFDPVVALADGISLNHKGLFIQASRTLNDALSRLPRGSDPQTRAEILLEAGLADSNIRFNDSAQQHFAEAETLMAGQTGPRVAFIRRKYDAYRALDLLNQRKFPESLRALDRLVSRPAPAGQPLEDPAVIRLLNQPARDAALSGTIAAPETAELQQLVLDAQANWARSIALTAIGDLPGAQKALDQASASYRPLLNEHIDPRLVLWLGAQINRQQGRLQARARNYPAAIASFDRALSGLRQSALRTAGTGTEPAIAEMMLERASIVADAGGDPARVRREYDQAIDAIVVANESGSGAVVPVGVERYLDLLVAEAQASPSPDTYDRYFRAMQAVGEPAVARQLNQLQAVVTSDPAIGVKVRDRAELERDITRLRYDIAAGVQGGQPIAELNRQRSAAEAKLLALDAELGASARYRAVDDRPATVADIRQALRPGEGFLKIVELNRRAFALYVNGDRTWIYPVAVPKAALDQIAVNVRASIDGKLPQSLVPFDVAGAYGLFGLLTGPATEAVLKANALVIDPAGPLQNLPAGVLVTDRKSVDSYRATAAAQPFDFSHVSFLAAHAAISTAVSARSFLVARALPPSTAKEPFLGLGEHAPGPAEAGPPRDINVGFGCSVSYATLASLSHQLAPIDRKELAIASAALGVPNAPEIVGASFSDTAVEARGDLADFDVLHFATHGLEEGVWGCTKSPPALVTSFGDKNSDGLLSFSEIARLRLDANLVVLSACDTASGVKDEALARRSGQEEAGSTLEGLVRAFLTANSRAVLATFWPVSAGGETDQFIKAFYSVARQRTIGGSLQSAQMALMANPEFSHPFYWGPYFVVGDATKMMLSGPALRRVAAAGKSEMAAR